jgi:hypothetical protein
MYHHGKDRRAAVPTFIAVNAGDDRVFERHCLHRLRHALGLHPIDWAGLPVFDVTKTAASRANIAKDKEGGCTASPALT